MFYRFYLFLREEIIQLIQNSKISNAFQKNKENVDSLFTSAAISWQKKSILFLNNFKWFKFE